MRAGIPLLLVISALTASALGEGHTGQPIPTLNWNANPRNFSRSVDWVRSEAGYYFVKLGEKPRSLHQLYREARATGSAVIVIDNWQAPRQSGCTPISLAGASWNTTAGTFLEARGEKPLARFRWQSSTRRGEFLQVDLASRSFIDLAKRPAVMLHVRSSQAGRFMRLRLLDLEGGHHSIPLEIPHAGKWVRLGPFLPGLTKGKGGVSVVRALRFEKTRAPTEDTARITIEVGEIRATRRAKDLTDLFVRRGDLGDRAAFVRAIMDVQRLGGRVVLAIDACRLPDDCRLVADGALGTCVARDADARAKFTVDESGRCVFEMRPQSDWSRRLSAAVSDELIRAWRIDGVFVKGLPPGESSARGVRALLGRLRASMKSFAREPALFAERADAATLRFADVACGPQVKDLKGFVYATAGLLVDVPIRAGRDVDALHRTFALGLKIESGPEDLTKSFANRPGGVFPEIMPAALTSPASKRATAAEYQHRLTLARQSCARFLDHWQGGRWRGRILTRYPGCEIYHFVAGREHLFNVVNASASPAGPIVLDVSHTRADRFIDVVSGRVFLVQDGRLTLHLEAHGFAMLRTALTIAGRAKFLTRVKAPSVPARSLTRIDE